MYPSWHVWHAYSGSRSLIFSNVSNALVAGAWKGPLMAGFPGNRGGSLCPWLFSSYSLRNTVLFKYLLRVFECLHCCARDPKFLIFWSGTQQPIRFYVPVNLLVGLAGLGFFEFCFKGVFPKMINKITIVFSPVRIRWKERTSRFFSMVQPIASSMSWPRTTSFQPYLNSLKISFQSLPGSLVCWNGTGTKMKTCSNPCRCLT